MKPKAKTESRNIKLKYAAIVFSVVFLISGTLLLLKNWEKRQGAFPEQEELYFEDLVEHEGKQYVLKENVETLLILGLDEYLGESVDSYNNDKQADFLMLVVIDNDNLEYTALHINRDTITEMNILGVAGDKVGTVEKQIALAHTYGNGKEVSCRNTATAVSKLLFNATVDHYLSVTMDAVPIFNDSIGGVEITVLDDFTGIDETLIKGEKVNLEGQHVLNYVQTRYGLEDSTNDNRMNRQQQYLKALYNKTKTYYEDDKDFFSGVFAKLTEYIVSDSSVNRLQQIAEKLSDYELTEICELEGEITEGEDFMEFYPEYESLKETVIKLFYKQCQ